MITLAYDKMDVYNDSASNANQPRSKRYIFISINNKTVHMYSYKYMLLKCFKIIIVKIYGVPQERRRTVNPLRGKTEFLANETVKVNPNGGKQGGIPKKESTGIANKKSDPNGRQKELVPRHPQGNSNKNPSGSNSAVPVEAKGNP